MRNVLITGGNKGLGKAIKDELILYNVDSLSRKNGYDLSALTPKLAVERIDILILNAGAWENDWKLNYETPKEMAEQMPKDKLVIFILSNAAYQDFGNSDYTAAKSGLLHYARRKQREGYQFATISPGTIDTNFWDNAAVDNRKKGCMNPEVVAELVYQIIKSAEKGALITELVVLPLAKNV